MIPFLKKKQEAAISTPVDEVKMRKPDEDAEFELLDVIAEDLMDAIEHRNVNALKQCLLALVEHIKEEDEIQDELEY